MISHALFFAADILSLSDLVADNNESEYAAIAASTTNTNSEKAAGSIREMDREKRLNEFAKNVDVNETERN